MSTTPTTPVVPPINPMTVLSPKASVAGLHVVHDGGAWQDGDPLSAWSCAELTWEGRPAIGLRWNGGEGQPCGMPQSRGIPIWFVIPEPLGEIVLHAVRELKTGAVTAKSLRRAMLDLVYAARRAPDEELARL
jgi:hypothetical protein